MAHIRKVPVGEATGELEDIYERARARSGRVPEAVVAQGLSPSILAATLGLRDALMYGHRSPAESAR